MKPYLHAESSAKRWGGIPDDYIEIHNLMDSSKAAIASNPHRMLTHNSWFIKEILERIPYKNSVKVGDRFPYILNSDNKKVSVGDIGEQHVLEDFRGFIPTPQDYASLFNYADWLDNGEGHPPSGAILVSKRRKDEALKLNDQSSLNVPHTGTTSMQLDGGFLASQDFMEFEDGREPLSETKTYNLRHVDGKFRPLVKKDSPSNSFYDGSPKEKTVPELPETIGKPITAEDLMKRPPFEPKNYVD